MDFAANDKVTLHIYWYNRVVATPGKLVQKKIVDIEGK